MNRFLFLFFVVLNFKIIAFNIHVSEVMVNPSFTSDAVGEFVEVYSDSILNDSLIVVIDEDDTLVLWSDWVGYQVFARESLVELFPDASIRKTNLPSLINSRSFKITMGLKKENEDSGWMWIDSVDVPISTKAGFSWQRIDAQATFEESQVKGLTGDFESLGRLPQSKGKLIEYLEMIKFVWSESNVILNLEETNAFEGFQIFVDNDLNEEPDIESDSLLNYTNSDLVGGLELNLVNHWIRLAIVANGQIEFFSMCDSNYLECGPISISQIYPFTEGDETEWIEWELGNINSPTVNAHFVLKKDNGDSTDFSISDLGGLSNQKKVSVADSLRFRESYGQIRIGLNEFEKWLSLNNMGGSLSLSLDGTQIGYWQWQGVADSSRAKVLKCENGLCLPNENSSPGQEGMGNKSDRNCSLFSELLSSSSSYLIIEGLSGVESLELLSNAGQHYASFDVVRGEERFVFDMSQLSLAKGRYYLKNKDCVKVIYWGL